MGRLKKHQSKRVTLRTKYKIQRKVKEFKRKQTRLSKKFPHRLHKSRRDPGIPNSWPFKDALIAQIQQQKEDENQKAELDREARKAKKLAATDQATEDQSQPTAPPQSLLTATPTSDMAARTRQTLRILHNVIDTAHLILFCLDARDPLGSRDADMEVRALKRGDDAPPVVYVLTHCDLVPSAIIDAWTRYLTIENPTVTFVTDHSLDSDSDKLPTAAVSKPCPTLQPLMSLLTSYKPSESFADTVRVAVMGYENTGKSSVINSLLRKHRAGVSKHPGYTKDVAVIPVHIKIQLLDTPGIPITVQRPGPHISLPVEQATEMISALVDSLDRPMLLRALNCSQFDSPQEFLELLARKQGKFLKGGAPNTVTAARNFIRDWNDGKVPYYVYPPANTPVTVATTAGIGSMFVKSNRVLVSDRSEKEKCEKKHYIQLDDSLFNFDEDENHDEDGDEMEDGEDDSDSDDEAPELVPIPADEVPVIEDIVDESAMVDDQPDSDEDEHDDPQPEPTPVKGRRQPARLSIGDTPARHTRSRGPALVVKTPPIISGTGRKARRKPQQ